jgi:peptide/nickel transport system permease protein
MQRYLVQRLAFVPIVVLLVATLVFLLVRLLPGDIVDVLAREAPQYGDASALRAELGLDRPLLEQYGRFLLGAVQLDLGDSLYFRHPVMDEVKRAVPVTLELALLAVLVSTLASVPLGVLAAAGRNGPLDYVARVLSVLFTSVPTFWLGTLVLTGLALWFRWVPPLQYTPLWEDPAANLQQFLIPALVLGVAAAGTKLRMVRSGMLDVLGQDYIRTARAKGLGEGRTIRGHALRNALVPTVALIGNQMGVLLGGAAVTETIFNLPGLGRMLITAVDTRDYPAVQAAVLVIALLLVTLNVVVDLVYAWLDPRIRFADA